MNCVYSSTVVPRRKLKNIVGLNDVGGSISISSDNINCEVIRIRISGWREAIGSSVCVILHLINKFTREGWGTVICNFVVKINLNGEGESRCYCDQSGEVSK